MHVSEESITTEYAVSSEKVHILQSIIQQYRVDDGIKAQFRIRFFMCWISNIWCKTFFTGKKISNRFNLYFVNLSGRAKISVPQPTLPALVLKFNYQSHPTPHISQNTKPFYKHHERKFYTVDIFDYILFWSTEKILGAKKFFFTTIHSVATIYPLHTKKNYFVMQYKK